MPTAKRRALSAAGRAAIVRAAKKRWGKASRGGGDRTIRPVGNTQLVHSTYRENRNNRTNHMSEVHGGDTAGRMQLTRADEEPSLPSTEFDRMRQAQNLASAASIELGRR